MSISILLSSSLRSATNDSLNLSIMETVCRTHIFDQKCQLKDIQKLWNEILWHYSWKSKKTIDWFNIFLFNVCALNQQCTTQRENRILQSTQQARVNYNNTTKRKQLQLNEGESIRFKLRLWLECILNLPFFDKMFTETSIHSISKNRSLRYLLETIDYLINKYQLSCKFKTRIAQLIENSSQSSGTETDNQVSVVNKRIFGSGEKLSIFLQDIQTNYSLELKEIAELIAINYIEFQPPRHIFMTTQLTGKDLTQEIIDHIVRKVNKTDLFSEKMESFRPYELLMNIIFQKQAAAIAEWNCFLLTYLNSFKQTKMYSLQLQQIYQKFGTFLSVFIPNDYAYLHHILKYIYSILLAKYSSSDSFQLMKKFVLNRLFLNPHYFSQIVQPNELQVMQYVKFANSLRVLFYEKKVIALCQTQSNPRLQQISTLLINSLKKMLGGKQDHIQGFNMKDRGVYVNDKLVIKLINKIGDNFAGFTYQSANKSKISAQSQSELSFSLKNESISRFGNLSSNQHLSLPNNSSLPNLPKPHQKVSYPRREQQKKSSQSERKQSSQAIFPIEGLQELIAVRKQYGELSRQINTRCYIKRERNSQKMEILYTLNQNASEMRGELAKNMNQVIINSLFF